MNDGPGNEHAKYPAQLSYDEESNITYELGWKQTLLDGRMTFNFAGYYGNYDDFIAGTNDACPEECTFLDENGDPVGFDANGDRIGEDPNGDPIFPYTTVPRTSFMGNVGKVKLWGLEADMAFRTE